MGDRAKGRGGGSQASRRKGRSSNGEDSEHQHPSAVTAGYVGDMVKELRALCLRAGLPFLAYLLHLAHEEAEAQSRRRVEN